MAGNINAMSNAPSYAPVSIEVEVSAKSWGLPKKRPNDLLSDVAGRRQG